MDFRKERKSTLPFAMCGRYTIFTRNANLFDAFPDNPDSPQAFATTNLRASLKQVLATGKTHRISIQKYDIAYPQHPGKFLERYQYSHFQ